MNNIARLDAASVQTMSSREIADLCEKEHKNVLRDVRTMLIQLYGEDVAESIAPAEYQGRLADYISDHPDAVLRAICGDGSDLSHQGNRGFRWHFDNRGYITHFDLDYNHTMTLIAGYKVKLRKAIIDKWQELEAQAARPVDPMVALNDPATMRSLLLGYSEKVLELEQAKAELTPKAEALDRLATADGSLCITDAAKALQVRPKDLFAWMQANHWIYRRHGTGWIGYQAKVQAGYLEHKLTAVTTGDGREKITEQVRVTTKGLARLAEDFAQKAA